MNTYEILKWAAGVSLNIPRFDNMIDERILYLLGMDEEEVVNLLIHHRLANRFMHRYTQERPGWCSRYLLDSMLEQCAQSERQTQQHIFTLQEITKSLAPRKQPLLCVKGITEYALIGEPYMQRHSTDMDLLYDDLDYLWDVLKKLGYSGVKLSGTPEYAVMERENIKIELHHYMPVRSYPVNLPYLESQDSSHTGYWEQNYSCLQQRELRYEDMLEHSTFGVAPGTASLCFANPTLSAFIRCNHLFMHLATQAYVSEPCAFKLIELADIVELTQHPAFDRLVFQNLMDRFQAQTAVQVASCLSKALLHMDLELLPRLVAPSAAMFPRKLLPWFGWASLQSADNLKEILKPANINSLVRNLGANTIHTDQIDIPEEYTCHDNNHPNNLKRVLFHSVPGEVHPLHFFVTRTMTAVNVDVILQPLAADNLGYYVLEWYYQGSGNKRRNAITKDSCSIARIEGEMKWNIISFSGADQIPTEKHCLQGVTFYDENYCLSFKFSRKYLPMEESVLRLIFLFIQVNDSSRMANETDSWKLIPLEIQI